jgi:hypothetical protein
MRWLLLPLEALVVLTLWGCTTDAGNVAALPSPPSAEACPETFDRCVALCHPRGVADFGCWSELQGVEFRCECSDGSRPAENPAVPSQ